MVTGYVVDGPFGVLIFTVLMRFEHYLAVRAARDHPYIWDTDQVFDAMGMGVVFVKRIRIL